jgi:hypothetical protein
MENSELIASMLEFNKTTRFLVREQTLIAALELLIKEGWEGSRLKDFDLALRAKVPLEGDFNGT